MKTVSASKPSFACERAFENSVDDVGYAEVWVCRRLENVCDRDACKMCV